MNLGLIFALFIMNMLLLLMECKKLLTTVIIELFADLLCVHRWRFCNPRWLCCQQVTWYINYSL